MTTTRCLASFLGLMLLALLLLTPLSPIARAADPDIVRVKVNGAVSNPCGDTWATACGLQYAITSTIGSDRELWVAAGTYTPTTGTNRTISFQLRSGLAIYGGFAMTETLREQRNFTANVTILSGDIDHNDTANPATHSSQIVGNNSYHVVTGISTDATAVLDGFTVTAGNASNDSVYPHYFGGGIYNNHGSPTVVNVTFSGNSTIVDGGGMYNYYSHPTLANVTFIGNTAPNGTGGGMHNRLSSPTLTNVTFSGNTAEEAAGMCNEESSSPTLTNATFSGNGSTFRGGGMYNNGTYGASNPTLTNVTFASNSGTRGGGMYNNASSPTLVNVTFSGNWVNASGGGMANDSSIPIIRNAIFWGNGAAGSDPQINGGASIYDAVVQAGCPTGSSCTNVIDRNPQLSTLGHYGGSTQTIALLPGSYAIDAGDDATCAPVDQRGVPRPQGVHCDMGAFESRFELTNMSGGHQTTVVNSSFAESLQVSLIETGGLELAGVDITFTAPSSGASAAWSGSLTQTATTNASGLALVGPPTANGVIGSYGVVASAPTAAVAASFVLTNIKHDTIMSLTSSANPSVQGQSVTLTAAVSGLSPSGFVGFREGGADLAGCASIPLSSGSAQCVMSSPALGPHDITAGYSGDATNAASSSALTQVVGQANTTTAIASSANPIVVGHPVTFTVTVSAAAPASGIPTGSVSFYETLSPSAGARPSRAALASQPLVDGAATFAVSSFTAGTHNLQAQYSGDANWSASNSALFAQQVQNLLYYFPWIQYLP